jgi:hypothetical protein
MAAEEESAVAKWPSFWSAVRRCSDYKAFLAVFCYAALFVGLPALTIQLDDTGIRREFGMRGKDLRLAVIVDGLGVFLLTPFIIFLGRIRRRPLFMGVALLFTGASYLLVFLAHLLSDPAAYLVADNSPWIRRITCGVDTVQQPRDFLGTIKGINWRESIVLKGQLREIF